MLQQQILLPMQLETWKELVHMLQQAPWACLRWGLGFVLDALPTVRVLAVMHSLGCKEPHLLGVD